MKKVTLRSLAAVTLAVSASCAPTTVGADLETRGAAAAEPRAVFDENHRNARRGNVRISVPEKYDFVNAIAPTEIPVSSTSGLRSTPSHEQVVRRLAELMRDEYQDASLAKRAHDLLLQNLASSRYDGIGAEQLAVLLQQDLRALARDQHLEVSFDASAPAVAAPLPKLPPAEPPGSPPRREELFPMPPRAIAEAEMSNYGLAKVEVLPGNIGVMDIRSSPQVSPELQNRFAAAFELVRDTEALIVDLRQHGGGMPITVAYFLSYFVERDPFVLTRIHWRKRATRETWTSEDVQGPRYGERRPLFVLTSSETFSGGEELAYDLKHLNRGVVVGERTRGGANPGAFLPLGYGFSAYVPFARAESALTGTNWEGTGVIPHVAVPAEEALTTAHRLALEAALQQQADPARRSAMQTALKGLGRD